MKTFNLGGRFGSPGPSKYNNKKTEIDGIKFDSKREADRYCELVRLKQLGAVREFTLQPRFELIPKFEQFGVKHRATTYVADFDVIWLSGEREVIDVKGFPTEVFKLKEKMFRHAYPNLKLTIEK